MEKNGLIVGSKLFFKLVESVAPHNHINSVVDFGQFAIELFFGFSEQLKVGSGGIAFLDDLIKKHLIPGNFISWL